MAQLTIRGKDTYDLSLSDKGKDVKQWYVTDGIITDYGTTLSVKNLSVAQQIVRDINTLLVNKNQKCVQGFLYNHKYYKV